MSVSNDDDLHILAEPANARDLDGTDRASKTMTPAGPQQAVQARRSSRATLLVSDDARERTARRLGRAYTKGRLTQDELDARTEQAWAARTRTDLDAISHDLPRPRRRRRAPLLFTWPWALVRLARRRRYRRLAHHRPPRQR